MENNFLLKRNSIELLFLKMSDMEPCFFGFYIEPFMVRGIIKTRASRHFSENLFMKIMSLHEIKHYCEFLHSLNQDRGEGRLRDLGQEHGQEHGQGVSKKYWEK